MKDKKRLILMIIIIAILVVILVCGFLILNNNGKNDNPNGNNPGGTSGENSGNNQGGNSGGSSGNNQGGNSGEGDGNGEGSAGNPNGGGSSGNSGNGSSTSSGRRYNLSCKRTIIEDGVDMTDSLSLQYHKTNGLQSEEVILTMKSASGGTKEELERKVDAYQQWFDELKEVDGITITTTKLEDKTIFNLKTDYTKLDYSKIDLTDGQGLHLYNVLQRNDSYDFVTSVLTGSLYSCQEVEG